MVLQVGVKIFIRRNGKYLIIKRSSSKYPDVRDCWDIPGGRIEIGKPLLENLAREIAEETKMVLHGKPRLVAAQDILRSAEKHVVRLTYEGEAIGEPDLDLFESDDYRWLTREELLSFELLDRYAREVLEMGVLHETRQG